jgi:hypothetical protein
MHPVSGSFSDSYCGLLHVECFLSGCSAVADGNRIAGHSAERIDELLQWNVK